MSVWKNVETKIKTSKNSKNGTLKISKSKGGKRKTDNPATGKPKTEQTPTH